MSHRSNPAPTLRREGVSGIPDERLPEIEQDFRDAGAIQLETRKEDDGTWTLIAVFEDE
jgi:hypothetical protein